MRKVGIVNVNVKLSGDKKVIKVSNSLRDNMQSEFLKVSEKLRERNS